MGHYTYSIIDLCIIGIPLLFTFKKSHYFYSHRWHVLTAVGLVVCVFIPWNMGFTAIDIKHFNPDKNLGLYLGNMPLEAYLYVTATPFFCLLIYAWLRIVIKNNFMRGGHFAITPFIIGGAILLLMNLFEKTYTALSLTFLILLLMIQLVNGKRYMGKFYLSFLLSIIPLLIIDLVLANLNVTSYNLKATSGLHFGQWPMDTIIFDAGLCLLSVMGYEWSNRKFFKPAKVVLENTSTLHSDNT